MAKEHQKIIEDLVAAHAGLAKEHTTLQKEHRSLQKKYKQLEETSITWTVRDFLDYEMDDGWEITKKQAEVALKEMIQKHDCNNGITWDTVEYYYKEWGTKLV